MDNEVLVNIHKEMLSAPRKDELLQFTAMWMEHVKQNVGGRGQIISLISGI